MVTLFLMLTGLAAAEPAPPYGTTGFRTTIPVRGAAVSSRLALVQDLDGASIGELTLQAQVASDKVALAVEAVGAAATSPGWNDLAFGTVLVDLRHIFGRKASHAFGLRARIPTTFSPRAAGPVAWWGTVPEATMAMPGLALAYELAGPGTVLHMHLGWRRHPQALYRYVNTDNIDAAVSVAVIRPLSAWCSYVFEAELLHAPSPLHGRLLARAALGERSALDLGLAVPLPAMLVDPSVQVLSRIDYRW